MMGKVKKLVKSVTDMGLAGKVLDTTNPDMPDVKSPEEIEAEAQAKSSEQARRFSKARKTQGKTVFTSKRGVTGMDNLKQKYGN